MNEGAAASRVRWLAAAALATLALSRVWDYEAGSAGTTSLTDQFNPYTGGLDLVPCCIPGTPADVVYGYQSPVRIFLLVAVAGSPIAALGARARLAERLALGGLVAAFVLALSANEGSEVLTLGLALVLVGGPLGHLLRKRFLGASTAPHRSPATGVG
ncbi:MAG: hypothetical protein JWN20_682 [Jatrophihabitantaceae bacterium]|nr:hypothetical protein [Jatrophihabitantaceae bacterium]